MKITFDPAKNELNIAQRGLSFDRVIEFDFESALYGVDDRRDYDEVRMTAIGKLGDIAHVLVFTMRGDTIRVISFRKANKREVKRYEKDSKS